MKAKAASSVAVVNFQEETVKVSQWMLRITSYRCGEKFVSIVTNIDPRATICRVSGTTREEAHKSALDQTYRHLSLTEMPDVAMAAIESQKLALIHLTGEHSYSYTTEEFLRLPIGDRMNLILSGSLVYYDSTGCGMSAGDAMQCLHSAANSPRAARAA